MARRKPRRNSIAAVVAVMAVAGTACANSGPAPIERVSPGVQGPRRAVQNMLEGRARALVGGDRGGYLGPVAPEARKFEEQIATGAAMVHLAAVDLFLRDADYEKKTNSFRSARVEFIFRYKGVPADNVFRFGLIYRLVREKSEWRITESVPDPRTISPFWATGPVNLVESSNFLVMFRPGLADVDKMLGLLEQARGDLLPKLTLKPDRRFVVILTKEQAEFIQFFGGHKPGGAVALADTLYHGTKGHPIRPENRQIVVNVPQVLRPDDALYVHEEVQRLSAKDVFQHELGHLALSRFTRPTTPSWVSEGAATYLSEESRVLEWRHGLREGEFDKMSLSVISGQDGLEGGLQYAYAKAAVLYLIERDGLARFWDFYRNFKDVRTSGNLKRDLTEGTHRLLRRFYDLDEQELDRHTREYIRKVV